MQPLSWYVRRARSMSPGEVAWRLQSMARDAADRCRLALDIQPSRPAGPTQRTPAVITPVSPGCWSGPVPPVIEQWRGALVRQAEAAAAHRLTFFNLVDRHLGDPIQWNVDHETGHRAPLRFSPSIDYRDVRVAGDAKVVWEPSRHHQLVLLGRAYRATGRREFADAVAEQIASWIEQCPYGRGMQWRSPLELAIRLINWTWALDLIKPSGVIRGAFEAEVLHVMHLHLWDLTRKYSRGSSANNHRLGEAAGVFVATSAVPALFDQRWHEQSRHILADEVVRQTYDDGGTREQALSYHLFVLQFALAAAHVGQASVAALPRAALHRVSRMLDSLSLLCEGGPPPMFGDSDDGYVLDLGGRGSPSAVMALGAAVLGRPELLPREPHAEAAFWILGDAWEPLAGAAKAAHPVRPELRSRALEQTGVFLLQGGVEDAADSVSVTVDAGDLGYGPLAAHGHADALGVTLRIGGDEVLVDTGTCDYFSDQRWRRYFRTTPAHNTIAVDGEDQSIITGPFMWGARAGCRVVSWEPARGGGRIVAEHDGYTRLADPVTHRRSVTLDAAAGVLTVADTLEMRGEHDVSAYFHLSDACSLERHDGTTVVVTAGARRVRFELDDRLTVKVLHGSLSPPGGWLSRGYHQRTATCTIVGSARLRGTAMLTTRIAFGMEI